MPAERHPCWCWPCCALTTGQEISLTETSLPGVPLVWHFCTGWQPGRTGKDISMKLWERYHYCTCEHGCLKTQVFKWAWTLIARVALLKLSPWWPEQSESLLFQVLSPGQALQTPLHPWSWNEGFQCLLTDPMTPQDCRMCSEPQGILLSDSKALDHGMLQVKTFSLCKLHLEFGSLCDRV